MGDRALISTLERDQLNDRRLCVLASIGLAFGAIFGMAGTFVPFAVLRGLAWGIDGMGLVMAGAVLTLVFARRGEDLAAAGFLIFAIGEGLVVSGSAMDLMASVPTFGAGASLWAVALVLISSARVFPLLVRVTGFGAALLFGMTALQIYAGAALTALTAPLPFFAYPVFVATLVGWAWTLLQADRVGG